jgi:hypothetical protein
MVRTGRQKRANAPWRILLALVCVLLVVVLGAVQVAHTHADGTANHADCALCAAAHISVHPVHAPSPAPATAVVATLEAFPPAVLPRALAIFALFTRPPPPVADIVPA